MVPNGLPEPCLSSKEMISLLEREGLTVVSVRGSHRKLRTALAPP
jgi:predicted RNA binding protein YcfA (HicA-like mRNA interferase family)